MIEQAAPVVSMEELAYAHTLAGAAANLKTPVENPANKGLILEYGDGKQERIQFTDIPENRAMFALQKEFGRSGDRLKFYGLVSRVYALQAMMQDPRFEAYAEPVPDDPGQVDIEGVIFAVAADFPMTILGDIDPDAYLAEVERRFAAAKIEETA